MAEEKSAPQKKEEEDEYEDEDEEDELHDPKDGIGVVYAKTLDELVTKIGANA